MSKFNVTGRPAVAATSPVITDAIATAVTYEGASGYARDAKSELFLLAVSNMVGENTFYEAAGQRDARFAALVRALAVTDPDWTARLIGWLRNGVNLRSAALVAAAEFVAARLAAGQPGGNRQVIASVLVRADEPGELLAYWFAAHGRNVPQPVKRGVAAAAARLYTERSLLKWDSAERSVRFADVLELTHAAPVAAWQGQLFRYAIDRRHNRSGAVQSGLPMLAARSELMALPVAHRRAVLDDPDRLAAAGMTWEALAGWLQGPLDAGGLAGGDPVDGLHGPAAEPAEFRPRRGAGPGRGAGGGPAGRPGSGRPVATAADAIPGRLPGGAAAAVGGGAGERAAGIAGRSSVAAGPDAGARRPVRVHVRFGNLGGTNYRRAFRCTRGTSPATGSGTVRRGWACGTPSAA